MPGSSERGKLTLPWSLLLLGSGYFLLVAGPLLTSRFATLRWVRDLMTGHAWLPAPAAAGSALLGAAALIYVVARLVRDVEQRPYASIAPVLAVFSGFVLTSTRAELPLSSAGAPQLGILVLALALLGGVLVGRNGVGERALGWLLAVLPSLALIAALMAVLGASSPVAMLRSVDGSLRTYIMLLTVSSLCLALVGAVARHLARPAPSLSDSGSFPRLSDSQNSAQAHAFSEPGLRLPRPQPSQQGFAPAPVPVHKGTLLGTPMVARTMPPRHTPQPVRQMQMQRVGPTGYELAQPVQYNYGALAMQSAPELSLDDPDLVALTRPKFALGRALTGLVAVALLAAGGIWFFVLRPQHDADLARVRSAALPAAATTDAKIDDAEDKFRALIERTATEQNDSLLKPANTVPSVAPLAPAAAAVVAEPTVAEPAVAPPSTTLPQLDKKPVERAHHHARARHHRSDDERAAKTVSESSDDERAEPARAKALAREQPLDSEKKPEPKAEAKPAPSKPAAVAAPKPTQNESDLDLDSLLNKAVKSSNGVDAREDPILGL